MAGQDGEQGGEPDPKLAAADGSSSEPNHDTRKDVPSERTSTGGDLAAFAEEKEAPPARPSAAPTKPTKTPPDPFLGQTVLGRFEITRRIGRGGMGAVYAAKQVPIGREVAVKVLKGDLVDNEGARERFRREAAIIGSLRHPNTIQLIDYGETEDGTLVMITELLVGSPLSDRLKNGTLSFGETIELGLEIAGSLREAHSLGLVHRDLKPANIFLVEVAGRQHAKVLDFGIARIADEDSTRLTATGQVFGTPRYMSPEQGLETGGVDARSDLYSLGLMLFECLVGQPPFVAQTSLQYIQAHVSMAPPRLREALPDAPAELEAVIDSCLVKNRDERIQTAEAFEKELEKLKRSLVERGFDLSKVGSTKGAVPRASLPVPTAAKSEQTPAPPRPTERSPLMLASLAAVGVAIGLGVLFALFRNDQPRVTAIDAGEAPMLEDAAALVLERPDRNAPDASAPDAEAPPSSDATSSEVDAGKSGKKKPKKKGKGGASLGGGDPGSGVVFGPREMTLPGESDEDSSLKEAAKACKRPSLATGAATLKVAGCKAGCAVLVDGGCAGLTPLDGLAIEEGNKTVSVVCGGKLTVDALAKLRPGSTFEVRCR
ncbi:MAG: serine/threonine protein kinase [Deltaproteobacteria bacterium]|nr:serine/threonine protein kinase [Deltaproteobacteria bacterium]